MKKTLVAICSLTLLAICAHAADGDAKPAEGDKPKKPEMTAEQKALRKEMTEKYDADKDGKLTKEERAKMSDEDKAKWKAAFPPKKKTEGGEEHKHTEGEKPHTHAEGDKH